MKYKNRILFLCITIMSCLMTEAKTTLSEVTYTHKDSLKIVSLLREAKEQKKAPGSWMLWFGKKFAGIPYVGGTLDRADTEKLVVNTRQLDCTTYVETVLALSRCAVRKATSFIDYCEELKQIRYIGGEMAYTKRQHYFTVWMDNNEKEGIVKNITANPPFTAVQEIHLHWMSTHQSSYKMLTAHPKWLAGIKEMEQKEEGKRWPYIPKENIVNTPLLRNTIHDGDILVILTNKKGLDTSHIGIASWHSDGLHLLNASSIHKKVIDEPMLLRTYMARKASRIGIRVCRQVTP